MGLFDRVEKGLERAVNGAFAKAFKSEVQPVELASAIRRAMDDRATMVAHGKTLVPNLYGIELSPTDYDRLADYEDDLSDELVAAATEHVDSNGYKAAGPLQVTFSEDEELETGVFRVRPGTSRRAAAPAGHARAGVAAPAQHAAAEHAPAQQAAVPPPPAAAPHETHRQPAPTRSHAPAQRPWLVIDGERYPLIAALTVVGRDELADIVLDDPGVSRRHCEVLVTTDGPHLVTSVRDLGSTNGTYVNGERISSIRLHEGDQITVGRTQAIFRPAKR